MEAVKHELLLTPWLNYDQSESLFSQLLAHRYRYRASVTKLRNVHIVAVLRGAVCAAVGHSSAYVQNL